jgi:twinkle protein
VNPLILDRLEGVRRAGNGWIAKCPAHDDHHPSLSIGEGSDGKTLLRCHAGCSFDSIVRALGVEKVALFPEGDSLSRENVTAVYTYRDEHGQPLYQVRRTLGKDFRQFRFEDGEWKPGLGDVQRVPFELPRLRSAPADEVVAVVEGEKDALRCIENGFIATTNSGGGKNWPGSLNRWFAGRRVVVLPDNDETGRAHARRVYESLSGVAHSVRIVEIPNLPPKGDVSDFFDAGGTADQLRELIEAKPLHPAIVRASDLAAKIARLYETGLEGGVSTGWRTVDRYFTVRKGELTLVTGIPGHGKSAFLDAVMVNLARKQNWKFGVFSAENLPLERHAASILEKFAGKPFGPGPTPRMTAEELRTVMIGLEESFLFIQQQESGHTVGTLLEIGTELVQQCHVDCLVFDPWNEIEHMRPDGISETEYISLALTKIRRFARVNNVHVFLVVHPTKLQKDRATGNYPIPTPYDCSGSAHWRNKADNAITVWRDVTDDRDVTQIHVQKIRFREVGRVGMVELQFDRATGRYFDIEQDEIAHWRGTA